jgi:hypothetical protein
VTGWHPRRLHPSQRPTIGLHARDFRRHDPLRLVHPNGDRATEAAKWIKTLDASQGALQRLRLPSASTQGSPKQTRPHSWVERPPPSIVVSNIPTDACCTNSSSLLRRPPRILFSSLLVALLESILLSFPRRGHRRVLLCRIAWAQLKRPPLIRLRLHPWVHIERPLAPLVV